MEYYSVKIKECFASSNKVDNSQKHFTEWKKIDTKGWFQTSHFIRNSRTDKHKLWLQRTDHWLTGGGWVGYKEAGECSGVMDLFGLLSMSISINALIVWLLNGYTYLSELKLLHLKKPVHFIVCNYTSIKLIQKGWLKQYFWPVF